MEGKESGPLTVPQDGGGASNVATNSPLLLALTLSGVIKEVSHEDVVAADDLLLLSELLAFAQVHVTLKLGRNVSLKATESFVFLDLANGSALVRADGHDRAVIVNGVDNEAKAVEFSQARGRNFLGIERANSEVANGAEAH